MFVLQNGSGMPSLRMFLCHGLTTDNNNSPFDPCLRRADSRLNCISQLAAHVHDEHLLPHGLPALCGSEPHGAQPHRHRQRSGLLLFNPGANLRTKYTYLSFDALLQILGSPLSNETSCLGAPLPQCSTWWVLLPRCCLVGCVTALTAGNCCLWRWSLGRHQLP